VDIYTIGDPVIITGTFRVGETLTNPGAVTLKLRPPVSASSTITSGFGTPSTGVRTYQFNPTESGWWHWRLVGTAPAPAVIEGAFYVRPTAFP